MLLPQCTLILDGAGLDTAEAHTDGGHRKVHAGVHSTTGMYHVKLGAAPDNSTRLARRVETGASPPMHVITISSASPPRRRAAAAAAGGGTAGKRAPAAAGASLLQASRLRPTTVKRVAALSSSSSSSSESSASPRRRRAASAAAGGGTAGKRAPAAGQNFAGHSFTAEGRLQARDLLVDLFKSRHSYAARHCVGRNSR
jgi:hypothetical protein